MPASSTTGCTTLPMGVRQQAHLASVPAFRTMVAARLDLSDTDTVVLSEEFSMGMHGLARVVEEEEEERAWNSSEEKSLGV
ncbi:hypothetical protein SNOG_15622 [Parastagonospora nodorum SN15]|uniref:Uncharacterized protein n=1 Tax=Phaeosphaeria nodorum (strain SN15 / ATCC MYA-4574 / FGSC 10173) TaxID=321614 RepID=Q0TXZ3_PHANO|nr:hypothetical protein SNOG_15622 [Parastagonospora nodorum SN15]EAT76997.1 hypothetical protein SNOG_15622 [Parastagonospora nodorum SN15]